MNNSDQNWQGYFRTIHLTATLLLFSITCRSGAQNYLVGVRGGTSLDDNTGYFRQVEAFTGVNLPWRWDTYFDLSLQPRVEASAGCLDGGSKAGFIGTVGPDIELRVGKFPVTLEGGASPTFLSRYSFGEKDVGGWFQFTSHIGLNWHVTEHFTLGLRFQHMSNAGIYKRNPGLNMEMLSTSYSF